MPNMKIISLKIPVPLTFEDISFLESDLGLIEVLVKALNADLPVTQKTRIKRIRAFLISIKNDKSIKFFKYEFEGL